MGKSGWGLEAGGRNRPSLGQTLCSPLPHVLLLKIFSKYTLLSVPDVPPVSYTHYSIICDVLESAYTGSQTTSQLCSVTSCWKPEISQEGSIYIYKWSNVANWSSSPSPCPSTTKFPGQCVIDSYCGRNEGSESWSRSRSHLGLSRLRLFDCTVIPLHRKCPLTTVVFQS